MMKLLSPLTREPYDMSTLEVALWSIAEILMIAVVSVGFVVGTVLTILVVLRELTP